MESSTPNKDLIYDRVRGRWVVSTPEEKVRQNLLAKLIQELCFPKALISVEKALSELPLSQAGYIPLRRVDIACFIKAPNDPSSMQAFLLIECKESKRQAQMALEQVKGYNFYLKAPFIAVAYPEGEIMGWGYGKDFKVAPFIPPYQQLLKAVGL